ncbi:serine/threonine protein kinase [Sedimentitalea sp. CY04]|uniref:Serine/threonine protein kinase n=2 Tax=Parasedimentitalea denitrificans TaxID=2211118 RepID=A0ABX0WCB1_9RHOB|nr:D-Ala-D-Ala carboxypeptidase family metallohydrolase [Sedimentitalea sp. CY04]NIZ63277.1 serine/threonine protein kinase [Sedimentitalea sp. CY04]
MGDLSKNFSRSEFKCKCGECEQVGPDPKLIPILQDVRDHFGKPVTVHSGHRCRAYNESVGGVEFSQHPLGTAGDFTVAGVSPRKVQDYLLSKYPDTLGIGRYRGFTHVDVREGKGRWDKR